MGNIFRPDDSYYLERDIERCILLKVGVGECAFGGDALAGVVDEELLEQRDALSVQRPVLVDRDPTSFPLGKAFFVVLVILHPWPYFVRGGP